jgi:CheY-like chemotaxis protein
MSSLVGLIACGIPYFFLNGMGNETLQDNLALIIDDDPNILELLKTAVEEILGCRVVTAINGESGLYEARQLKPDLILLDWIMPEMTGLEMLDELKLDPATKSIPVYMITRRTKLQDAKRARELGAVGYFLKPIDFDEFCAWLVEQFPDLAETRRAV